MSKLYFVLEELVRKRKFRVPVDSDNFSKQLDEYEGLVKSGFCRKTKETEENITYYVFKVTSKAEKMLEKIRKKRSR